MAQYSGPRLDTVSQPTDFGFKRSGSSQGHRVDRFCISGLSPGIKHNSLPIRTVVFMTAQNNSDNPLSRSPVQQSLLNRCFRRVQVEQIVDKPGYAKLLLVKNKDATEQTNQFISGAVDRNGLLSADKLANRFMGELKRCLQSAAAASTSTEDDCDGALTDDREDSAWMSEQLRHIDDRTTLRRHGPAIQMDVMHLADNDGHEQATPTPTKLFYSVDMVPTVQISGANGEDDYYVAKPIKRSSHSEIAWRRSFSVKEKEWLATLDEDNGCRKQVLRVLKVIRNGEAGLAPLTSYHLKTVMFRKIDELSDPVHWRSDCLGQRLMDVIGQLEKELGRRNMPHYYLPEVNLLDGFGKKTVFHMRQRLKHLKNSEKRMTKLLSR